MRYPYERFLRYLLTRKANVHRALERIGLPSVGDTWLPKAERELRVAAPPQILRYLGGASGRPLPKAGFLDWAAKHGIDVWWREQPELGGEADPALALAGRIFFSPATRAVVGMLLLAGVSRADLRAILNELFRLEVDDIALSLYERAYWNTRDTSHAFWTDVLQVLDPEERQLYSHGIHWPPLKLDELRHLLGLGVGAIDPEDALQETLAIAQQGLREAARAPVPEHQSVFQWAALVERTAAQVRKGRLLQRPKEGQAAPDPAAAFSLFSVTVDRLAIPTLAELQGELPELPGGGRK